MMYFRVGGEGWGLWVREVGWGESGRLTDVVVAFGKLHGRDLSHPDAAAGPLRRPRLARHKLTVNTETFLERKFWHGSASKGRVV